MPLGADGFCLSPEQAFAAADPLPAAQWAPWKKPSAASSSCCYRGVSPYFKVEMQPWAIISKSWKPGVSLSSNLGSIFCSADQFKQESSPQPHPHDTRLFNHLSCTHREMQVPTSELDTHRTIKSIWLNSLPAAILWTSLCVNHYTTTHAEVNVSCIPHWASLSYILKALSTYVRSFSILYMRYQSL